jgi:hypothetical protein
VSGDIRAIWDHLGVESDESVVLSAVYELQSDSPALMAASLLVGPGSIASTGWPGWRLAEGFKPVPQGAELEVPATFLVELESVIAARSVLDQSEAYAWLRSTLEDGRCPSVGDLPEATASLAPARAPIRVSTHSQTEAGDLATYMTRPITAFHFPRNDGLTGPEASESWTVGNQTIFMPAVDLLGFSWFPEKNGPPPGGLLVGRFERRGWLVSQKLIPEDNLYTVEIGLEPDRAELADLEIEVEEQAGDELVFAEHLKLEDIDIRSAEHALDSPPPEEGRLEIGIALPTLGRKMKRLVRLTHRDGTLLDEWRSFNIVESISFTLVVNGAEQPPVTTGDTRQAQDIVELLGAVERVRSHYATMRRKGTANRIFHDIDAGREPLRAILRRVPGELLVVDAYLRDWELLSAVSGPPPRVLIGSDVPPPPPGFAGSVGRWRKGRAPFHDRFFLWEGGGVSVGTSAGAIHDRLFRIVRMSPVEADTLRSQFALWWQDPGFEKF